MIKIIKRLWIAQFPEQAPSERPVLVTAKAFLARITMMFLLFTGLAIVFGLIASIDLLVRSIWAADLELYNVIGIKDGDTIVVMGRNDESFTVRMLYIDAPEKKQAFGVASKSSLSDKIFDKNVVLEGNKKDRYGRRLSVVKLNGKNINLEQVEEGLAWHYERFSQDQQYSEAQERAKNVRRGLWRDKTPIPPWEFRGQKHPVKPKHHDRSKHSQRTNDLYWSPYWRRSIAA
jgi:endonuclease YncB( thermonuclease family)